MRLKVALLVALGTILILVSSALLLVRVRDSDQRVDEANRAIAAFGEIVALPALAIGIGNPGRGDAALGHCLLGALGALPGATFG